MFSIAPFLALTVVMLQAQSAPTVPEPDRILAVNDDMRQFLHERVADFPKDEVRMQALVDVILGRKGLGIEYGSNQTRTAIETFEAKSGNCLSFTNLFVALARELGLAAYFEEVDDVLAWDRRGQVLVNNRHMFAVVEMENGIRRVDFSADPEKQYRFVTRISDERAAAHYYNNVGAEKVIGDELEAGLTLLLRAVEIDPTLSPAWINLGVAYRRLGRFEDAEEAYRTAIADGRFEPSAYANLAYLYEAWGRSEEAATYLDRARTGGGRNPYHLVLEGSHLVEAGDYDAAIERFRRALRRAPDEAAIHFALGDAYYRRGDISEARRQISRALDLADNDDERQHYQRALELLDGSS